MLFKEINNIKPAKNAPRLAPRLSVTAWNIGIKIFAILAAISERNLGAPAKPRPARIYGNLAPRAPRFELFCPCDSFFSLERAKKGIKGNKWVFIKGPLRVKQYESRSSRSEFFVRLRYHCGFSRSEIAPIQNAILFYHKNSYLRVISERIVL